jgi:hypothetical protein
MIVEFRLAEEYIVTFILDEFGPDFEPSSKTKIIIKDHFGADI